MRLLGLFKKYTNSLDSLSDQKKMFLVNYLGERFVEWGVDDPVKERYPDIEQNIEDLHKAGLITIEDGVYLLTDSGLELRKIFRVQERARRQEMHRDAVSFALSGDYVASYNSRARYESESVIPHGINADCSSGSNSSKWKEAKEIPNNVKKHIENSYKLDFSDCENSEKFRDALRRFYVGMETTGASDISIPDDFEKKIGENLNCRALDVQLAKKCQFPDPPKLKIYFRTKVRVFNYISTKLIDRWDGEFDLGIYDCTDPFHASIAEYERLKAVEIDGFPKTFATFQKHKLNNSEKYLYWASFDKK